MASRWRLERVRKPVPKMILVLLVLSGLTAGEPPVGASAPHVCLSSGTGILAKSDTWGTPNPAGRNCTGFPVGVCALNQYGE